MKKLMCVKTKTDMILIMIVGLLILLFSYTTRVKADCTPTRQEAINWLNNQSGVWYDLDNKYGAQCSDFVSAYMNWLYSGETNPALGYLVYNASYYPTVAGWNTARWDVFSNSSSFSPEPGDIYVQSGHVGVFLDGSKSKATVIDQNSWETWDLANKNGGSGRAARIYSTNVSDSLYFIRYKYYAAASAVSVDPRVVFSSWENSKFTYIKNSDASIGQQIDVYDGTCTEAGMYLYNQNGDFLGKAGGGYYYRVYFKINEELGVTLSPGTPYKYKFYAIVNGKAYWSNESTFNTSGTTEISSVSLNASKLSLKPGESYSITASVLPDYATNKTVTWSSSNTSVATISNGKVTAVAAGTSTITAKAGNKSATCSITVYNPTVEVSGLSLNKTSLSLVTGGTETLSATVTPSNATNKTVTWSSSDSSVAKVDNNGNITAVAVGKTTITAKSGNYSVSCYITVSEPIIGVSSVTLNISELSLLVGESERLTATVYPLNASDKKVTWMSSDYAVVRVDGGLVSAVSVGTAVVTAKAGEYSGSCIVTVQDSAIADIDTSSEDNSINGKAKYVESADEEEIGDNNADYNFEDFENEFRDEEEYDEIDSNEDEEDENRLKVGTVVKIKNGLVYKVTDIDEVTVMGINDDSLTTVTIPESVIIYDCEYEVVSIQKNAFKGNKKLKRVTILADLYEIGDNAFSGCKALERIDFSGEIEYIGRKAFYKCSKLKQIYISTEELPEIEDKAFSKIYSKAAVKVPSGMASKYKKILKNAGLPSKAVVK